MPLLHFSSHQSSFCEVAFLKEVVCAPSATSLSRPQTGAITTDIFTPKANDVTGLSDYQVIPMQRGERCKAQNSQCKSKFKNLNFSVKLCVDNISGTRCCCDVGRNN